MNGRNIQCWADALHAEILRTRDLFWVIPPGPVQQDLLRVLDSPDALFDRESRVMLKDTATTKACLTPVGQHSVFLKRTNNKSIRFTLRYLFRPARSFRAAIVASALECAGVHTPRVLAAGERRRGLVLYAGYLVTETEPDLKTASECIRKENFNAERMDLILCQTVDAAAALHAARIVHNDMKLANFYYTDSPGPDARIGVLDLDSAEVFAHPIPPRLILRSLARILSSFLFCLDRVPDTPDAARNLLTRAGQIAERYPHTPFAPREIARVAYDHWLVRARMNHPPEICP